ncbi:MAG TPA: hypothetical protein VF828_00925 [Patescibacteria group bacterium]
MKKNLPPRDPPMLYINLTLLATAFVVLLITLNPYFKSEKHITTNPPSSTILPKPTLEVTSHSTAVPLSPIPKNWLTYKNSQYGFEFKYPPLYKIAENTNDFYGHSRGMWGLAVLKRNPDPNTIEANQLFELTLAVNAPYDPDSSSSQQKIKIGNNEFISYFATKYEMFDIYSFDINNLHLITLHTNKYLTDPVFNQVLSSFKFTK